MAQTYCSLSRRVFLFILFSVLSKSVFAEQNPESQTVQEPSEQTGPPLIPIEAWIHDPVISEVSISPDGSKLAALTLADPNAAPDITVWETKDLSKAPRRFAPKDSKVIDLFWANSEKLLVIGRQKFDWREGAKPLLWFRDIAYLVDTKGKKFHKISGKDESLEESGVISANLVSILRHDPEHILIKLTNRQFSEEFRLVDLERYTSQRIFKGGEDKSFRANTSGDVYLQTDLAGAGKKVHFVYKLRTSDKDPWQEHFKLYASERQGVTGIRKTADDQFYVIDNTDREFSVIRSYDPLTKQLSDPLFAEEQFEMVDILTSSAEHRYGMLIGYVRDGAKREWIYTDPIFAGLQQRIDAAFGGGSATTNRMVSMSDDMRFIVVRSSGVKEAGAYYLLVDGRQLVPLGRAYPNLEPAAMAEMEFVHYPARDKLSIPGYLTTPTRGKAPYPAVILPHGGPWARDYLSWDAWAQFLANRGYLILQPQYRGSEGFGQTLWRAGDREWGQKMQDDKDDGAKWLVEQGLAAKDRIAIFGYSYGGYAAMAAAVRKKSPYQCAIAGAGLSELATFDKITFTNPFNRQYQNPTVEGMSPLQRANKATIPIYIFHGDRDQRVPVEQSRKFVKALEKAGKEVKYYEIPDLWHSHPWFPQHKLAMFSTLEDYLANDCGPGGL